MTTIITSSRKMSGNLRAITTIMAYQHPSLLRRIEDKCGISGEAATELFDDTKRFLYLCADSNVPLSPTPAIDGCWHEFLLFTKDYADFCRQFFGVFLHHRPRYINDPPADGSHRQNTINAAKRHFSNLSKNWEYPPQTVNDCDHCMGCRND